MQIANNNIILTGAASGIGHELLLALLQFEQVNILAVDQYTITEVHPQLITLQADLSKQEGINQTFALALQKWTHIDLFIANAGYGYCETLGEPNWEKISHIFSLNVFSPIYALQKMKEQPQHKPFGMVIVSSAMAHLGIPGYALYAATKAALDRFEETYHFEKNPGDYIGMVYPVATQTQFFSTINNTAHIPYPIQSPRHVAQTIIRGILNNTRHIYPSRLFYVFSLPLRIFHFLASPYQYYYKRLLGQAR